MTLPEKVKDAIGFDCKMKTTRICLSWLRPGEADVFYPITINKL